MTLKLYIQLETMNLVLKAIMADGTEVTASRFSLLSSRSLGPRLVWSFPRPAARSLPSHPRPSGAPRAPSLRVGHPPRGPSATLVASRWRVFRLRREPTTPVRLASSLATLVPPGRRALRAAYGESDEKGRG